MKPNRPLMHQNLDHFFCSVECDDEPDFESNFERNFVFFF